MEFTTKEHGKLSNMITNVIKDSKLELEIRLGGKHLQLFDQITRNLFDTILKKLIFDRDNGGHQLKYEILSDLDIIDKTTRVTLSTQDIIKKYVYSGEVSDYTSIEKKRKDVIDINNYNLRIALASEIPVSSKIADNLLSSNKQKTFRYKRRYSVVSHDKLFRFDLTIVKSGDGVDVLSSNVFNNSHEYEVEMEYIGKIKDKQVILDSFVYNSGILLQEYLSSNILSSKVEQTLILSEYKKLTKQNRGSSSLITANPVTLHRKHINTTNPINITQDYAVSYKADGERHFMMVVSSSNRLINENVYLIDKNMKIKKTGWKLPSWSGTLVEGEYIKELDLFLGYDILFAKNIDIRNRHFNTSKSQTSEATFTRDRYLHLFMNSFKTHGVVSDQVLITANLVRVHKKEVLSSSGNQIFDNIKKLISGEKKLEYETDGFIFTPINHKYPMKPGTWTRLLKWKPANLNSIDFHVIIKKENGVHKIDTHTHNNELQFYKTLILQVSKHVGKNYIPVNFNPINPKNESAHTAAILLDNNNQIMTADGLNEITDETIVEFTYNKDAEHFKWNPIRIRYDKTEEYRLSKIKGNTRSTANNENTANDIWTNIHFAVDEHMLTSGEIDGDIPITQNLNNTDITQSTNTSEETEEMKETEGVEEMKETEGVEEMKETDGVEEMKETNGVEEMKETNGVEEMKETDGVEEMKETDGVEEMKETDGVEEMKETDGVEEMKETDGVEDVSYYDKSIKTMRLPYRFYNNYIKSSLYNEFTFMHKRDENKVKLLDIGSGKGGDINKYISSEIDYVVGIDLSKGDVDEGLRRYNSIKNKSFYKNAGVKTDINFVWGDMGKLMFPDFAVAKNDYGKQKLTELITDKNMFDIVSCQFAFHYFFTDKDTLLNVIRNVSENLKVGGHFIGTTFDGDRIMKLLKNKTEYESSVNNDILWKIEKKYDLVAFPKASSDDNLNITIDVNIGSIGNLHPEPLVNFKYFEKVMKENGFVKVKVEKFNKYYMNSNIKMSKQEQELSFLYNTFVFKKVLEIGEQKIRVKKIDNK
jgi:SAM-dependent methyltransferase